MSQSKQYQKTKKMRGWKIACYMLSFPLFIFAVFCSAIKYMGQDPFTGKADLAESLGMFISYESFITGPAFYGLWIALGIWLVVTLFHLLMTKTVKNHRARMFAVIAFCMVIMFGGLFAMDAVFEAKITEISESAPEGVTVENYKQQLSLYRTMSTKYKGKSYTALLKDQVAMLEKVYNVDMLGADQTGTAGNMSNKPVTYYNIISDEGVTGVDIDFKVDSETGLATLNVDEQNKSQSGKSGLLSDTSQITVSDNVFYGTDGIEKDIEGNQVVRLCPNSSGQLVINGQVYSHYYYEKKSSMAGDIGYVWYTIDLAPASFEWEATDGADGAGSSSKTDGIYGSAIYNRNGTLADGWIFSVENVVEILEDYYEAEAAISSYSSYYTALYEQAILNKDAYYTGAMVGEDGEICDAFTQALYQQETDFNERFSLTRAELDEILALVGSLLGNNEFMTYLLKGGLEDIVTGVAGSSITGIISPILEQLPKGYSLSEIFTALGLDASILTTVTDVVDMIAPTYVKATVPAGGFVDGVTYYTYDDETGYYEATTEYKKGRTYYTTKETNDVYIVAAYDSDLPFEYRYADEDDVDEPKHADHLYIALVRDDGEGNISTKAEDIILDLDFADYFKEDEGTLNPDGSINYEYAFDLDNLSAFINTALDSALGSLGVDLSSGILNTVLGLLLSTDDNGAYLSISGLTIYLMDAEFKHFAIDINGILVNLLSSLYSYQSPTILPYWEFFVDWTVDPSTLTGNALKQYEAGVWYRQYYRALYAGQTQGALIGSQLIGGTVGDGTYDESLGLADLASVQQLKTDLSYQPLYYPLFSLRDMLMLFSGIVVLFYFLSFCAAEKEAEYAAGEIAIVEKQKKAKKSKKNKDAIEDETQAEGEETSVTEGETPEGAIGDDWKLEDANGENKEESAAENEETSEDEPKGKKGKKAKKEKAPKAPKEKKPKKEKKGKVSEEETAEEEAPATDEAAAEEKSDVPEEQKSNEEVAE